MKNTDIYDYEDESLADEDSVLQYLKQALSEFLVLSEEAKLDDISEQINKTIAAVSARMSGAISSEFAESTDYF